MTLSGSPRARVMLTVKASRRSVGPTAKLSVSPGFASTRSAQSGSGCFLSTGSGFGVVLTLSTRLSMLTSHHTTTTNAQSPSDPPSTP